MDIIRIDIGSFPNTDGVFLFEGKPLRYFGKTFRKAVESANLRDFRFHDFRHTAINNFCLAGNDFFQIMEMSDHRSTATFKRYNTITEEELSQIKWRTDNKLHAMEYQKDNLLT